jgi:acyl-coenzyme A thioesterase PaaI-like protein
MANTDPLADLQHFQAIPWCAALLSKPGSKPTETFCRTAKDHNEDTLFGLTLKTSNTITHAYSTYVPSETKTPPLILSAQTLFTLSTGMNGGPNALHGGIIATLMDETMGTLLKLNHIAEERPETDFGVTASMDVRFRKLVITPGTYCVGAKITGIEGKRVKLEAWVGDEEGDVCAKARSLWILVTRSEDRMKL